jgi:hypothetical protein
LKVKGEFYTTADLAPSADLDSSAGEKPHGPPNLRVMM